MRTYVWMLIAVAIVVCMPIVIGLVVQGLFVVLTTLFPWYLALTVEVWMIAEVVALGIVWSWEED